MAGEIVVIDTSAWIFALRRNPVRRILARVDALLKDGAAAIVPAVRMELLGGTRTVPERDRLAQRLAGLIAIPMMDGDWDAAAAWAFDLRRKGITLPTLDLIIASPVHRTGAVLLHADEHFDVLAPQVRLKVESLVGAVQP